MAVKKGGLGRGLDSLFADTGSVSTTEKEQTALALRDIEPDRDQPRKEFDAKALTELSKSIEEHGVLQPIVVRPMPAGGYKIIAGERRWRAARQAGLTEIPAIVKEVTDEEAMELALVENLQREDLDPIEEALGYQQLMERGGYTQQEAAQRVSKSRSAVANSLRILTLPDEVIEMLQQGVLTTGHAKAVLSLPDAELQTKLAKRIQKEELTVRKAEAAARKILRELKPTPPAKPRPSIAAEVEISLRDALGTEVNVDFQEGKGKLSIGFYSEEQLRTFANLLGEYQAEL